ncbi:hypothetical protein T440DRAFT_509425 [Plenodomus tracheiphilus IPT5]|uniref:F-box domain-containing protein n=1 Tax=Plenodomus tracheiphilus IPT5 TaxID=1408161 RepID=A0A6A7B292_9PLEO|nr:hypothetical protein T440DRAFT_509425 [Plenodomus tracheiphilus IPT5]
MAPTTGSAAEVNRDVSTTMRNEHCGRTHVTGRANSRPEQEIRQFKDAPSAFLGLAPEVRNTIYSFCIEDRHDEYPHLLVKGATPENSPDHHSVRRFFALTQVNRQIRSEYRPLWLRGHSVRVMFEDLHSFIYTYYPDRAHYQHAPRLLSVSWDHGSFDLESTSNAEYVLSNIAILLELLAYCPTLTVQFVCHRIVEHEFPNRDCGACGHSIYCDCDAANECDHKSVIQEAVDELREQYEYLNQLNSFLSHRNTTWLQKIRTDAPTKMDVYFTFESNDFIVYIRFQKGRHTSVLNKKDMWKSGVEFLKSMGMLDLRDGLYAFVIGESTGRYSRPNRDADPEPLYDQVHIATWEEDLETS